MAQWIEVAEWQEQAKQWQEWENALPTTAITERDILNLTRVIEETMDQIALESTYSSEVLEFPSIRSSSLFESEIKDEFDKLWEALKAERRLIQELAELVPQLPFSEGVERLHELTSLQQQLHESEAALMSAGHDMRNLAMQPRQTNDQNSVRRNQIVKDREAMEEQLKALGYSRRGPGETLSAENPKIEVTTNTLNAVEKRDLGGMAGTALRQEWVRHLQAKVELTDITAQLLPEDAKRQGQEIRAALAKVSSDLAMPEDQLTEARILQAQKELQAQMRRLQRVYQEGEQRQLQSLGETMAAKKNMETSILDDLSCLPPKGMPLHPSAEQLKAIATWAKKHTSHPQGFSVQTPGVETVIFKPQLLSMNFDDFNCVILGANAPGHASADRPLPVYVVGPEWLLGAGIDASLLINAEQAHQQADKNPEAANAWKEARDKLSKAVESREETGLRIPADMRIKVKQRREERKLTEAQGQSPSAKRQSSNEPPDKKGKKQRF